MNEKSNADELGLIFRALRFASRKHAGQVRKGAERAPYINHPIAVAYYLVTEGNITDPAVLAAAILHDTVEDTDTSEEELREEFGDEVASLVMEVTDDQSLPREVRKQLQVEHAPAKTAGATQIKIADKLANITDITHSPPPEWSRKRVADYLDWSERMVDRLNARNERLETLYRNRLEAARRLLEHREHDTKSPD